MKKRLMKMLENRSDEMVAIRRYLHENPELSFQEEKNAQYIIDFYAGKDVEIQTNVGNGYGIIVTIKGSKPGKTIGLRADFDALPIVEETDVPFKSKNPGVMHACGHDGHTAYLLVLADCLIQLKEELSGTIKIIHQHAEESPPGGAKSIVESGLLDDLDAVYGVHLFPTHPAGAHFVTAIQTIISRRLNPFDVGVITIGSFDGKGAFNIIKDSVELEGDVRYMTDETQELIEKEVRRIVKGLGEEFGVTCELDYVADYPPLYNNPEIVAEILETLQNSEEKEIKEVVEFPMFSGSEDFAYYAKRFPGAFIYAGSAPKRVENAYFNHHPKWDVDEDALLVAAKAVAEIVCSYNK